MVSSTETWGGYSLNLPKNEAGQFHLGKGGKVGGVLFSASTGKGFKGGNKNPYIIMGLNAMRTEDIKQATKRAQTIDWEAYWGRNLVVTESQVVDKNKAITMARDGANVKSTAMQAGLVTPLDITLAGEPGFTPLEQLADKFLVETKRDVVPTDTQWYGKLGVQGGTYGDIVDPITGKVTGQGIDPNRLAQQHVGTETRMVDGEKVYIKNISSTWKYEQDKSEDVKALQYKVDAVKQMFKETEGELSQQRTNQERSVQLQYNKSISKLSSEKKQLVTAYDYNRVLVQKLEAAKEGKGLRTWVSKTGTRDAGTVTTKVGFDMPGGGFYEIARPKTTRSSRSGLHIEPGATTVDDFDFDAKIEGAKNQMVLIPVAMADIEAQQNTYSLGGEIQQKVFASDDYHEILAPTKETKEAGQLEEQGMEQLHRILAPAAFDDDGVRRSRLTIAGRSVPLISDAQLEQTVDQHYTSGVVSDLRENPERQTQYDKVYLAKLDAQEKDDIQEFKDKQAAARGRILNKYNVSVGETFGLDQGQQSRYLQGSATIAELQSEEIRKLLEAQEKAEAAKEAARIKAEQLAEQRRLEEEERARVEEEARHEKIRIEAEIKEKKRSLEQEEFEKTTKPKRPYKYKKSKYQYNKLKYGSNR